MWCNDLPHHVHISLLLCLFPRSTAGSIQEPFQDPNFPHTWLFCIVEHQSFFLPGSWDTTWPSCPWRWACRWSGPRRMSRAWWSCPPAPRSIPPFPVKRLSVSSSCSHLEERELKRRVLLCTAWVMIVKTLEMFKTQICSVIVAAAQNNTAVRAAKIVMELRFVAADWDKIDSLLIRTCV